MTRTLLAVLLFLTACGQEQQDPALLSSTLTSPTDVKLQWRPVSGAAGQVVEYSNEEKGEYTILEFLPIGRTTFEHPDLIPETNFYYRVRPYTGSTSNEVPVTLPPGDEVSEADGGHEWAPPEADGKGASPGAAPTELKAEVKHANGILFTWTDNSSDEDGYLLESRLEGGDYRVVAQLDPNVVSYGLITLPNEKQATYRVRAIRFGEASNLSHQLTGKAG